MKTKPMNKRVTGANQIGFVLAVLLAIVAVNVIGQRLFARWDLTQEHVYTLSQNSRDLVKNLPDRLTVKAYISGNLQPHAAPIGAYLRDLLEEYAVASGGKLVWEAIDPLGNKELEEEAAKNKVQKLNQQRSDDNSVTVANAYLGISLQYQGNVESIPGFNRAEGMEYLISSMIKRMTSKRKKVAFAVSEGEPTGQRDQMGQGGGLQLMTQNLAADFEIVPVQLNQGPKPIPDDVDGLVVVGPRQPMSERSKFVIDQFLMRGKSVAFFVDGMELEAPRQQMPIPGMADQPRVAKKTDVGLDDLFEHYGIKVRDDIVLEPRQNAMGFIPVQGQMLVANYPTFPIAVRSANKHSTTDFVPGLVMPFASSVEIYKDRQKDLNWTPLLVSTSDSWRQPQLFVFSPTTEKLKVGTDKGPFTMAVAGEGKLTSFFAGKPYPNEKGEKVEPAAPNTTPAPGEEVVKDVSDGPVRIVVVGNAQLALDEIVGRLAQHLPIYQSNIHFFMGVVGYVAKDDAMAVLRTKGLTARPLLIKSDATPTLVKLGDVVGVPLLFITFGLVSWRVRLARRRRDHI